MTKVEQQVPHIIVNGILDRETKEVAIRIQQEMLQHQMKVQRNCCKYWINTSCPTHLERRKKMEAWREQKNTEKTDEDLVPIYKENAQMETGLDRVHTGLSYQKTFSVSPCWSQANFAKKQK